MINWKINEGTRVVITTHNVLGKIYNENNVNKGFVIRMNVTPFVVVNYYTKPQNPFLTHKDGGGLVFSIKWGCLIVDEVQNYTNISTQWCQSIGAICAYNRLALSGTAFNEPKTERILGYFIILDLDGMPRTLPDTERLITSYTFKGLNQFQGIRKENAMFQQKP